MLLKEGHDIAPIRRGLLEAVGFAVLLVLAATLLVRGKHNSFALVVFGWPLILFYWLARWSGRAGVIAAMLAVVPVGVFFIGLGAVGGAPIYFTAFPFLPLAAVAVALIAESRSAQ